MQCFINLTDSNTLHDNENNKAYQKLYLGTDEAVADNFLMIKALAITHDFSHRNKNDLLRE